VVEHLPPTSLAGLMSEIARVLRPGAPVLLETPNPASFATHVHSFWRDPTHIRPVPAAALGLVTREAGLVVEEVLYGSRPTDDERLHGVHVEPDDPDLRRVAEGFNAAIRQLNYLLYGFQDYALIARRPT
jgi:SAM-dependent methyltransferase